MNYFRKHWYQVGIVIAVIFGIILVLWHQYFTGFQVLLTISLITLFVHQFEEYQLPGYFPRMVNTVMFKSKTPDCYPLNTNTALIINVLLGWLLYGLAIIFAEQAVWLAIASIMVSIGNVIAHTLLFNIKGKTLYNPGMVTSLLLFLPLSIYFFIYLAQHNMLDITSLIVGIVLGVIINYFGVVKLITILAKKDTKFRF